MVTIVAVIKSMIGKENEMESAFREMIEKVRDEEWTTTYVLHRSAADPTIFMFYEQYKDDEAFSKHSSTDYLSEMFERIETIIDGEPSISMYEELSRK